MSEQPTEQPTEHLEQDPPAEGERDYSAQVTPPAPAAEQTAPAALTAAEQHAAKVEEAAEALDAFEATVTQREWLLCRAKLDAGRAAIREDGSLRLLALGWIKTKREHGGASWDALLDMTDEDMLRLHGFPVE